jgi:hypothetical protein
MPSETLSTLFLALTVGGLALNVVVAIVLFVSVCRWALGLVRRKAV